MVNRIEEGTFFLPRAAKDGQTKLELCCPKPLPCSPTASTCVVPSRAAGTSALDDKITVGGRVISVTHHTMAMPDVPHGATLQQELATLRTEDRALKEEL